jgi:DHA2 family multidrug resistance protein
MSTTPFRRSTIAAMRLGAGFFPWAIAFATGLDYFDNTIFSFFTSYIAGGVNASSDELVWAATAYAVTSVLGILQQQWWIERIGYRRYVAVCLLLFSAGGIVSALSESSIELAVARGIQGYFMGPMMSTCRILLQISFTPQQRGKAVRKFLLAILFGSALAPLVGGYLVAHFDWRALFRCTSFVGIALAIFTFLAVPSSGRVQPAERGDAHLWPYLIFAFAQGALMIVLQQVRFELFSQSPQLVLLTIAGLSALAWFVWHQWHHPKPLMRLHALREKTFQTGILLYILFYYTSNSIGYLTSRFLESGLGYPVENAGRLVGFTSLGSLMFAFVYFRYSARVTHKKWMIAPGFMLAILICIWMTSMPPNVSEPWLVLPLMLRGLLLLFIAMPVANVTFRVFALEEFNHGYRFKNIVKQLTYSFSTATMIILEQHRFAMHQSRLAEYVNPFNPIYQNMIEGMTRAFEGLGRTAGEAHGLALVEISRMVAQQANFLSALDGYYFVIGIAVIGGLYAIWQKQID